MFSLFLLYEKKKKSMSVVHWKRRICDLLYLALRGRRTAIFAFHKFAKRKIFSTHPTRSTAFHWQLCIWISCHVSLEKRRAESHEWSHWLSCFGGTIALGRGGKCPHCEWTAGAQLVDGPHPVIPGWFLIWVSDEVHTTSCNLRIQKRLSKLDSLQSGPVDGA